MLGLLTGFIGSCQTPDYAIRDSNRSLMDIRNAVVAVIGDPRKTSLNQREMISHYFSRKPDVRFDPNRARERLYSKVTILGDRRPYDIHVEVMVEIRTADGYSLAGKDLQRAHMVGADIKSRLNQGRDDRNFIDDFRPF